MFCESVVAILRTVGLEDWLSPSESAFGAKLECKWPESREALNMKVIKLALSAINRHSDSKCKMVKLDCDTENKA